MALALTKVIRYHQEKKTVKHVMVLKREGIVGETVQVSTCFELVAQAASSQANTLIYSETGTGKELFARAIHANSRRAGSSFVVVDCASLPETLVEDALFGHEKGAYTGADNSQDGLIKQADGGTLFLDEVGELPLAAQRAFLRVFQEHCFRPLGGTELIRSDFKVIAATNRDLEAEIKRETLRSDLYFRLKAITIELPALRDRVRDIMDIAFYHLTKLCDYYGLEVKGFSPEFLEALLTYS
jgi:two-component system NtrC family response regulator